MQSKKRFTTQTHCFYEAVNHLPRSCVTVPPAFKGGLGGQFIVLQYMIRYKSFFVCFQNINHIFLQ